MAKRAVQENYNGKNRTKRLLYVDGNQCGRLLIQNFDFCLTMVVERKLAAIVSADVVAYSRLMGLDERGTLATLTDYRNVMGDCIARHRGRVVDAPGDAMLAEFSSPVEAVEASVEIQTMLAARNAELPDDRQMLLRIGINLGDVIEQDGAIYGDAVNIAARLQSLSAPGGICVSGTVFDQVEGKVHGTFKSRGAQQVKNIEKPVRIYMWETALRAGGRRPSRTRAVQVIAVVVVVVSVSLALLRGDVWRSDVTGPADSGASSPIVAVFPFTNMSGNPKEEYFSDGITEELITQLARFSTLRVLGSGATFGVRGKGTEGLQAGRLLGADYVLEGSVRRGEALIRVTAQLIDAKDGKHVWAETYERDLTSDHIFAIQDDIAQRVVAAIADSFGVISSTRIEAARRRNPESLSSYECVLSAHAYYREGVSPQKHSDIRSCLETAVERDPNYADAWAWLGAMYRDEYWWGFNQRPDPLRRTLNAARRALELESTNQEGRLVLAYYYFFTRDKAFLDAAERAVAVNPHSPDLLASIAFAMAHAGYLERAKDLAHKAISMSIDPPGWMYAPMYLAAYEEGDYEKALGVALKWQADVFLRYAWLAESYGQLERVNEARDAVGRLESLYPGFAEVARKEYQKWFWNRRTAERHLDGLRRAGLNMPTDE